MKSESIIVRCLREEFCESTLDGELYMNSLRYFLANGNLSQNDYLEGTAYALPISELPFSEDFRRTFSDEHVYGLPTGFEYLHVFCLSRLETTINERFSTFRCPSDEQFKQFGNRCLVIKDPILFFDRVLKACNELGYKVCIGRVSYRDVPSRGNVLFEIENSADLFCGHEMNVTPFSKGKDHEAEMEYRILVLPNRNIRGPLKLTIGSIRDIAYVQRIKANNGLSIKNNSKKNNVIGIPSDYSVSNCTIHELLTDAYERGSGKVRVFFRALPKQK